MMTKKTNQKSSVMIFYSSETEPDILKVYEEGITYLKESNIKVDVIDVDAQPKLAQKKGIVATPSLLVQKGNHKDVYIGIVVGLKPLLMQDLYGRSMLNVMGFREGRKFGKQFQDFPQQLEKKLQEKLQQRKIESFKLIKLDKNKSYVKLQAISEIDKKGKKNKDPICLDVASFFGGIFTEILGRGIHFKETQCTVQGKKYCIFETIQENTQELEKRLLKKVR